jgi:hypothetical protein
MIFVGDRGMITKTVAEKIRGIVWLKGAGAKGRYVVVA